MQRYILRRLFQSVLALLVPFFLLLCVALTGVLLIVAARRFRSRMARLREH